MLDDISDRNHHCPIYGRKAGKCFRRQSALSAPASEFITKEVTQDEIERYLAESTSNKVHRSKNIAIIKKEHVSDRMVNHSKADEN